MNPTALIALLGLGAVALAKRGQVASAPAPTQPRIARDRPEPDDSWFSRLTGIVDRGYQVAQQVSGIANQLGGYDISIEWNPSGLLGNDEGY